MAKIIRVMVAEDFPLLREDFCDVVSAQSDMEVVGSAASGEEIASLADTVPCDVILMDIEMENHRRGHPGRRGHHGAAPGGQNPGSSPPMRPTT